MQRYVIAGLTAFAAGLAAVGTAFSAGNLAGQKPIEVRVQLVTKGDAPRFVPGNLTFETGKLYRLILTNVSKQKHYFTSLAFAASIYTRKVQVSGHAEIKGAIREIEVLPGASAEWWFVPVATGTMGDLHCHIKDKDGRTHAQKGMVGTITIK